MVNTKSKILIFGAGGHAKSVASVAVSAGFLVEGFVDPYFKNSYFNEKPVRKSLLDFHNREECYLALGVGDNSTRKKIVKELAIDNFSERFPSLIHHSCVISEEAKVGQGTVAMPNSVLGPGGKIGNFCILNTSCSVDHDSEIADYASIGPGATLGGAVKVDEGTAISIGATIKHGINIGKYSLIGASSYIHSDVEDYAVYYGVPAKFVANRKGSDKYL